MLTQMCSHIIQENQILHDQLEHLTLSSDAMAREINVKETEIARLHECVREARRNVSKDFREDLLKKTSGTLIRRWKLHTVAKVLPFYTYSI